MRVLRDDVRRAVSASRGSSCPPAGSHRGGSAVVVGLGAAVVAAALLLTAFVLQLPLVVLYVGSGLVVAAALIAARAVLGNALAGVTLLLARPYNPGERVRLYAPELGGDVEAEVVRVGLVQTTLASASGVFVVPNTRLLRTPPAAGRAA